MTMDLVHLNQHPGSSNVDFVDMSTLKVSALLMVNYAEGVANEIIFRKSAQKKKVNTVSSQPTAAINDLFIGLLGDQGVPKESWNKTYLLVNNGCQEQVNFKIDTGAEANVLPMAIARRLQSKILPSTAGLTSYTRHRIINVGRTLITLHSTVDKQVKDSVWFELVDGDFPPILGLSTSVELSLVKRIDVVNTQSILDEFADCFQGIGCFSREHKILLDPNVKPVVNRARRIPLSMEDKVKAELNKMEKNNIITKIDEPTEWVNSMVVVEKKNKDVRICLDPRELNKAIRREHHHIPTLEEIAHKFSGMNIFTIVDMKHGYWHVPLDYDSQLLTTFNTPFGRYCFKRLPFGVNSAAEVFEKRVEEIFGDLDVAIYFDDLIVAGKNQEEHDKNLRRLLERARKFNVKFNRDKIQLNQKEVTYLGHIVSARGLKPDPQKVKAISEMPDPTDKQGIQRLLGSLNFLRGFIPDISQLTEPLRALLKNDSAWSWGTEQIKSMSSIKELLTNAPVLQYFDVDKETTRQTDASKSRLGAVLLQDGHPVAYASKALSETEQNYPQIDKELLAIVFGCEKFHGYVYGRPINIQTDHNPLVTIVKKELYKASPRLQRLLLRLLKYNINRITYVPGKYLYLADTLSRAYIGDEDGDYVEDIVMVHTIQLQEEARDTLTKAYQADATMKELLQIVHDGWYWHHKRDSPQALHPYWNYRDELHIKDGLIYRGEQLLIPSSLRQEYLAKVHQGHLGSDKCIERARQSLFWPGISANIREMVARCVLCQRFANQQQREPLQPHEIPDLPWNKVGMDILEFRSKSFLIVVDFYSHFPELRLLKQKRSEDVIAALKSIFAVHGVPASIMADNMPFNSCLMNQFAGEWGFQIQTSSPHYPRSNGMAERYVQTIKQFLKKSDGEGDLYAALLAYRQTPIAGLPYSPAELLFSRCIRGPLPVSDRKLAPSVPEAMPFLKERQEKQKETHDKQCKSLRPLAEGESIYMRTDKDAEWLPGRVNSSHQQPRSYIIDSPNGCQVRRNRVHLKPNPTSTTKVGEPTSTPEIADEIPATNEESISGRQPCSLATPTVPTPRRSARSNKGVLPLHFSSFDMS